MHFQTLDDKKECVGVYCNGDLYFNEPLPDNLSHTWSYSAFLGDRNIEYAKLYCGGKTIEEVCPEALKDRWRAAKNKFEAFIRSFTTSRVSLNENCFFDLVPRKFLLEFCYVKDLICRHIFENYEKPGNYEYLLALTKEIEAIRHNKVKINKQNLKLYKAKHRRFARKMTQLEPYCRFNIDGTKTGRLTTFKHSFPILTLDKELRVVMEPQNDYYMELDYNAAELRTLLALQGKHQPQEDIHEWNVRNIFGGTRDEAKKRIFAWLYNPESKDLLCEQFYDRSAILKKHYKDGKVMTFFGKEIESDPRTALNYIIQSTCAENVLRQMLKVADCLRDCKSFIAFPIHDSVVIDLALEDRGKVKDMIEIFSNTELGKFMVNVSAGKNFGSLNKVGM